MTVKYLIKTTEEYRLESLEDVKQFHEAMEKDATEQDYTLGSFGWIEKPVKEGKEIIDSYFMVKLTKQFDEAKDLEKAPMKSITYEHYDIDRFKDTVNDTTVEESAPWD